MKPTTSTIVRVALLIIALVNLALSTLGIVPEEIIGNEEAYKIGSYIVTAIMSLVTMWKNNSFTEPAILADQYMATIKDAMANSRAVETDVEKDDDSDAE